MNNRIGRSRLNNFKIILETVCSSTIVMGNIVERLSLKRDAILQCHTQAGNITTTFKVKLDFTLPALIVTNVITWDFHVEKCFK